MTKSKEHMFKTFNSPFVVDDNESFELVEEHYEFLTNQYHNLLNRYVNSGLNYSKDIVKSNDKFRNQFLKDFGSTKNDASWKGFKGKKAKHHRIVIENIRRLIFSQYERNEISRICAQYNYDKSQIPKIRKDLTSQKLFPTTGTIRNILRSKGKLTIPEKPVFTWDFSMEDNELSSVVLSHNQDITYNVEIFGQRVSFDIHKPAHVDTFTGRVSKPALQKDASGNLFVRVAYELELQEFLETDNVMGIDLGKVKPFSASVITLDSHSTELAPSKETSNLGDKILELEQQRNGIYAKIQRSERLWLSSGESFFSNRLERLHTEKRNIINKISTMKKKLSWLVARDILHHCVKNNVSVVKMEDLRWLESRGGKWNYSHMQDRIFEVLNLHGVKVYIVNAAGTSQVDPFTDKEIKHVGRRAKTSVGNRDRDYLASLEVAKRAGKKYNRKSKYAKEVTTKKLPKKSRDRHSPTPKRAKVVSKTSVYKNLVRQIKQKNLQHLALSKTNSGHDIAVHVSAKCSPLRDSLDNLNSYDKISYSAIRDSNREYYKLWQ